MFIETPNKNANGFYGQMVPIKCDGETWTFTPQNAQIYAVTAKVGNSVAKDSSQFVLPDGDEVALFTVESIGGVQFALCSASVRLGSNVYYNGKDSAGVDGYLSENLRTINEFTYILADRIDWSSISSKLPNSLMSVTTSGIKIDTNLKGNEALGKVYMSTRETWIMNASQAMLRACNKDNDEDETQIADKIKSCYTYSIPENTFVSVIREENIFDVPFYLVVYDGIYYYVIKDAFEGSSGTPIVFNYSPIKNDGYDNRKVTKTTSVKLKDNACLLTPSQASGYLGSFELQSETEDYEAILAKGSSIDVVGQETINNRIFFLVYTSRKYRYIDINACDVDGLETSLPNTKLKYTDSMSEFYDGYDYNTNAELKDYSNVKYSDRQKSSVTKSYNDDKSPKSSPGNVKTTTKYDPLTGKTNTKVKPYDFPNSYDMSYKIKTIEKGMYPESPYAPGLGNAPDRAVPPLETYDDVSELDAVLRYELKSYDYGKIDNRYLYKINRFRLLPSETGLSTKGFIFMTKPDLNIYKTDENDNVIIGQMNEDLKRIPIFKYVGRNLDIGSEILGSLEYWQTYSNDTPWMSIITNNATNYSPIDREIGTTEVGETFHGNKIIYGKHDFSHTLGGKVSITFNERPDLGLWLTLKLWTEYIHLLNLGYVEPHISHVKACELDYAVSLYYICTDITMENILYWEKLTGIFPLKCPDSFFEYDQSDPDKKMQHDIEFAYSMRSVMDTNDLIEINRLYDKSMNPESTAPIPDPFYSFNFDKDTNNRVIATLANEYYGDDYNTLMNNMGSISKYYYEDWTDGDGKKYKFLANYLPKLGIHGVPYVKGPFIVPDPKSSGGKFLMKWV